MIERVQAIAREAGAEILQRYGQVGSTAKSDQSPLTEADLASHRLIQERLSSLEPQWPVLSEESEGVPLAVRLGWDTFWLVDPLDGTKEFLKQSGEFTVNIALIQDHRPVLGVVFAPVLNRMYWAEQGRPAFKQQAHEKLERIQTRVPDRDHLTLVASRDHAGPQVAALLQRFPTAQTTSMGSSLKFCLVAEGAADVYLRDVPTMEWDTGAAQCIVEAAGGVVIDLSGAPLRYNKQELRNPPLVTLGASGFLWQ